MSVERDKLITEWLAILVIVGGIFAAVIVIAACAGLMWLAPRLTS